MDTNEWRYEYQRSCAMACMEDYTVVIRPDDNGTYVAYIPAIPGCHAWGKTLDDARNELPAVFEMIKQEYEAEGRPLPHDAELTVSHAG